MTRARFAIGATLVCAGLAGVAAAPRLAQQAPEFKTLLSGKKVSPPLRGEANVDFIRSAPRRDGKTLVTRIQVRNASDAPIQRLSIAETWYDQKGNVLPGGQGVINGLLAPGEVKTIEIVTPVDSKMAQSKYQFTHVNGTVKTHEVKSFGAAAEPAAKPAARKKK